MRGIDDVPHCRFVRSDEDGPAFRGAREIRRQPGHESGGAPARVIGRLAARIF
jgi:hypothetical protein